MTSIGLVAFISLIIFASLVLASKQLQNQECNELESLAQRMNVTDQSSPIMRECVQNFHCTGINCHARFKVNDNPMIPQNWLQPFCYAFELMSCKAPLNVLVRLIDRNTDATNYTYSFTRSDIRPVDKFKAKIKNAIDIQLYLNVTLIYNARKRFVTFGIVSAVKVASNVFGHYMNYPEWGKVELVPLSNFTVAKCTPETNFTISYNPCSLVPNLPDVYPTSSSSLVMGNCTLSSINGCGEHQMCFPDYNRGTDAGFCICAFDAQYNRETKQCEVSKPNIPQPYQSTTVIQSSQTSMDDGNSKLGLYIGVGAIVALLFLVVASVGVFFLYKRFRYRGHTRVLMVDDGLDNALMSDEDDMPINL